MASTPNGKPFLGIPTPKGLKTAFVVIIIFLALQPVCTVSLTKALRITLLKSGTPLSKARSSASSLHS